MREAVGGALTITGEKIRTNIKNNFFIIKPSLAEQNHYPQKQEP